MANGVSDVGVAQLSLRIEDPKGDYVNLSEAEVQNVDDMDICNDVVGESGSVMSSDRCWLVWWWARLIILLIFVGLLAAVFFKWVGPFVMNKVCAHTVHLLYAYVCLWINACQFRLYTFCFFDEMPASALLLLCLPMKRADGALSDHLLVVFLNASLLSKSQMPLYIAN